MERNGRRRGGSGSIDRSSEKSWVFFGLGVDFFVCGVWGVGCGGSLAVCGVWV